ncbi:uncharacterized protein DEA37_0003086 [Paragonimus westermani]|uniref:Reverse transcriptase domain-containing protein n=1 Tax=Paragonimus westermani TaxID=34504 RepID=A0A5J4NUX8_9TREM|nr:uncharacterized protein DEA37_0003086 [Paragonimus westermani]
MAGHLRITQRVDKEYIADTRNRRFIDFIVEPCFQVLGDMIERIISPPPVPHGSTPELERKQNGGEKNLQGSETAAVETPVAPAFQRLTSQARAQYIQHKVREIIGRHRTTFWWEGLPSGRTHVVRHSIDTGEARPIRQLAGRSPIHFQEQVQKLLAEMLERGRSTVNIPMGVSGSPPRIDETIDAVSGAEWFSTLDLASGYWQVEVEPSDRMKTAFVIPSGLYEFETMPFGLTNAPATFQRLMQQVLRDIILKQCLVYLGGVIVHGRSIDEHLYNLSNVLSKLSEAGLKLNPTKCSSIQTEVKYLRHVISRAGVGCDPEKHGSEYDALIVVPESAVRMVLEELHENLGHAGQNNLEAAARQILKGNGAVEHVNRTLNSLLKAFVISENTRSWDEAVSQCLLTYRAIGHFSTAQSPHYLSTQREMRLLVPRLPPDNLLTSDYCIQLHDRLMKAYTLAREHLRTARRRQKDYYDKKAYGRPPATG